MRIWTRNDTSGSVHAMGNGQMAVYAQGANIISIFGPPYSSPNIMSITTEGPDTLTDSAERELGTSIWNHKTSASDQSLVNYTEFVASDLPAYSRIFDCKREGVKWVIHPNPSAGFKDCPQQPNCWQQIIRAGQNAYSYPSTLWCFHRVITSGSCKVDIAPSGDLVVSCLPGKGSVAIVGGITYPEAVTHAEALVKQGVESLLQKTRTYWKEFTDRRLAAKPSLKSLPSDISTIADSVATLIKSQQSADGGVLAGHWYCLAYIRDQYGTARGMLSLGMVEEAKLNLDFRLYKYKRFGTLQTAETMGTDAGRHIHENDESEGPGYTILQARDYIAATSNHAYGKELWPMLDWCWRVQVINLANGLMPFNGDETYVAGGFFPRSGLIQGSADSTLVFVEAGKWLVKWAVEQGHWTEKYAHDQLKLVDQAKDAYRKYFLDHDRIWANTPERLNMITPPRFRHGVCEGSCGWFGWTERSSKGRYLCPNCSGHKDVAADVPARMEVNSVSLLPAYLGSDILSTDEMQHMVNHVLDQADNTGFISSVPGQPGCVGYDPGLLLASLSRLRSPKAKAAYDKLISLLDDTGAWVEYYLGDKARAGCCRCRPWESGINVMAMLDYALAHH